MSTVTAMRPALPPLPGLHAFEATARLGSFVAAADELHLSPATVSQRVRSLEKHFGIALFERLPRSVLLTEMGQAYLPTVRDLFDDLSVATTGLFGAARHQQLTVRVQVSYAVTWLMPRLHDFCAAFPHIDVRIVCAIWADALPPDEVDLEIRHGDGNWPGFTADLLHEDHAAVVCSPRHLERHGPIRTRDDLEDRPRVRVLGYDDLWQRLFPHTSGPQEPPGNSITLDTAIAATEFAAAGTHCALVPERFARAAVRDGRLCLAHDQLIPMRQSHYLLRNEHTPQLTPEARTFAQWLIRQDIHDGAVNSRAPGHTPSGSDAGRRSTETLSDHSD